MQFTSVSSKSDLLYSLINIRVPVVMHTQRKVYILLLGAKQFKVPVAQFKFSKYFQLNKLYITTYSYFVLAESMYDYKNPCVPSVVVNLVIHLVSHHRVINHLEIITETGAYNL